MAEYRVNTQQKRLTDARKFAMDDRNFTPEMKEQATALNFHRNNVTGEWSYRVEFYPPKPIKPVVKSIHVFLFDGTREDFFVNDEVTGLQSCSNADGELHILGRYRQFNREDGWLTVGRYLAGRWDSVRLVTK